MTEHKTLAFDLETMKLAREVAEQYADELAGESPWSRPDLFGLGVGVVIDLKTDVAYRYREAAQMISHLAETEKTVGYNTSAFDLGVLAAHGNVEDIRAQHVDINLFVREALDKLPEAQNGAVRIRQGGLDGLALANSFSGKTGEATAAPALLREGCYEEVLGYCEADVRLVSGLYRIARETGKLFVNGYVKRDGQRVELGRLEFPVLIQVY